MSNQFGESKTNHLSQLTETFKANLTDNDRQLMGLHTDVGLYELKATPFANETIMCEGVEKNIKPDEKNAYTLVAWLEGEDPECIDKIRGGSIGFEVKYELAGKE